jgi:hypothetical protein
MSSGETEADPRRGPSGSGARAAARRSVGLLAALVRIVTVVFAAVLVIQVVLVVASANPGNRVAVFIAAAADHLTLGLGNLFQPSSPSLGVILNYGLPAVVWLIIGVIVSRLLGALVR